MAQGTIDTAFMHCITLNVTENKTRTGIIHQSRRGALCLKTRFSLTEKMRKNTQIGFKNAKIFTPEEVSQCRKTERVHPKASFQKMKQGKTKDETLLKTKVAKKKSFRLVKICKH